MKIENYNEVNQNKFRSNSINNDEELIKELLLKTDNDFNWNDRFALYVRDQIPKLYNINADGNWMVYNSAAVKIVKLKKYILDNIIKTNTNCEICIDEISECGHSIKKKKEKKKVDNYKTTFDIPNINDYNFTYWKQKYNDIRIKEYIESKKIKMVFVIPILIKNLYSYGIEVTIEENQFNIKDVILKEYGMDFGFIDNAGGSRGGFAGGGLGSEDLDFGDDAENVDNNDK